jgi:hypothetical protein
MTTATKKPAPPTHYPGKEFAGTASVSVTTLLDLGKLADRLNVSRTDLIEHLVRKYADTLRVSSAVPPMGLRIQRTIRLTPAAARKFARAAARMRANNSVVLETLICTHLSDVTLTSVREEGDSDQ